MIKQYHFAQEQPQVKLIKQPEILIESWMPYPVQF